MAEPVLPTPTDEDAAERAVVDGRRMTIEERWEALRALLAGMDGILDGRAPFRPDEDPPFWQRWRDPRVGRPS